VSTSRHPARWIALAVAAVVVVLGVILALNVGDDPAAGSNQSPFLGKAAPAFDLPTLSGGRVSNVSTAGKVAIINFWNTWCTPCQQELPALKDFYAKHQSDPDLALVGIVRDPQESDTTIRNYATEHGMGWTLALDPGDRAALAFATRGQPETVAVDAKGRVVASKYGPMTTADLENFLAAGRSSS